MSTHGRAAPAMTTLWHIASVVVQHRPQAAAEIDCAVGKLEHCEVTASDATHRVVVTEGDSEPALLQRLDALRDIDGVLAVSLIYHHAEPHDALMEELSDADPS